MLQFSNIWITGGANFILPIHVVVVCHFQQISFAPSTPVVESAPESVSIDDIQRSFLEEQTTPAPDAAPVAPASAPVDPDSAEKELDPEFFHLRFNQANDFALEVNEAANNLLRVTDAVKVIIQDLSNF